MTQRRIRHSLLSLMIGIFITTSPLAAAVDKESKKRNVTDADTVILAGNRNENAKPEFDKGSSARSLRMEKMVLVLAPRESAKDSIAGLIEQQNDPKSPLYHQWLTPQQFGARFGISDDDLTAVTNWLVRQGFTVDDVAPGRLWINFSGGVSDVERAFKTSIHDFKVDGKMHHANTLDPQVPRALGDIVKGVVSLHDFARHPMNNGFKKVKPDFTSGTSHFIAPADFVKIYNVNPVYTSGITGTGQTIAIVGRTDIALADVQFFRSFFGLPANDPVFVHNGVDPGNLGGGEEGEADLDVEWSGAIAKNATVKFVISKSTTSTDGVDLSAQYIVTNNLAAAMSTSFGQCESSMGTAENTFYNNLWSQAATQGITSFVSSGDSGAAGCNGGNDLTGSGRAVSGLASTPFNVAVGGTQFNDTANPGAFWNTTNNSTDQSSVLGYIPEIAWNESGNVSGGSGLWSSAGGVSTVYTKPSWQVCVGVPADGHRDVPDVSLTAAGHDGYLVIQGHTATVSGLGAVGGTSASSPSFASLMALVVQKTGARQGNANTKFYSLANAQYTGTGPTIFHDTTSGNNSVPGVTGFNCGTGYDAVTGVGSVDVNAMVNNWSGTATPDFSISASPTSITLAPGTSGPSTITTAVSGGFNAAIALSATGVPTGASVTFSPTSIGAPGSGSSTMTVNAGTAAVGTYSIVVTGTGGSTTHTTTVTLTISSGGTNSQLLLNPGFESGAVSWTATTGVITNSTGEAAHGGTFKAWLNGYGTTHTDSVFQTVTIPATATAATLTFWLHIDSAETTTTTAFDTLNVQVRNSANTVLSTLATYSNLNKATGYTQKSFNLLAFKGQTIRVYFLGVEDSSLQTSFVVDDTALNVTN